MPQKFSFSQWDALYISAFRASCIRLAENTRDDKKATIDCADLAIRALFNFAITHKLPIDFFTGTKEPRIKITQKDYDSGVNQEFKRKNAEINAGAHELWENTVQINEQDVEIGDIVLINRLHYSDKKKAVNGHVFIICGPNGLNKGRERIYHLIMGNLDDNDKPTPVEERFRSFSDMKSDEKKYANGSNVKMRFSRWKFEDFNKVQILSDDSDAPTS